MSDRRATSGPSLHDLYAIIEGGRRDSPGPGVPWAVLEGLLGLIGCDVVSFVELDLAGRKSHLSQATLTGGARFLQSANDPDDNGDALFFDLYPSFWAGGGGGTRLGNSRRVFRWRDMYTDAELRNQPLYADFFRSGGLARCMAVELPALPGHTRRVLFWRAEDKEFSETDKLVLELLRPHLFELYKESHRRRQDLPRLTEREWQVLELAAQGRSNADIAGLLVTSVSTVRKHMEHIFDRTGVRTRSDAIAKMLD